MWVNIILPLFLLMMLGYFLKQIGMFNEEFSKVANNLVFKVLLPVLLFYNVFSCDLINSFKLDLILYTCSGAIVVFFITYFIVPRFIKDNSQRGVMIQGIFRSNFILFGCNVSQLRINLRSQGNRSQSLST